MAPTDRPRSTAEVSAAQDALVRYLHPHFRRKLTLEELRDVAAEALGEADRARDRGEQIAHFDRWLKRAAWHNALDAIRRTEGEGQQPRPRLRPLDTDAHGVLVTDAEREEFERDDARDVDARAVARAFERLKPDEQRALRLRYFDELPVEQVMSLLGCSRHRYENLCKRGLHKLRNALVADVDNDTCRAARSLVVLSELAALDRDGVATRDAHLESCVACRAFAARRQGLIAMLPLPTAGVVERLMSRVQQLLPVTHQHGEAITGSLALSGAGTAKTLAVVCSAGAVTAGVCATTVPGPKPDSAISAKAERRVAQAPASAAASPAPDLSVGVSQRPPATVQPPAGSAPQPDRSRDEQDDREAARDASPFLPESAAASGGVDAPAEGPTALPATADPAPGPAPSSDPNPATKTTSSFSQEFTP